MTLKSEALAKQTEARDQLRAMLPPGSEVKTILRHVSRSGISRSISVVIGGEDCTYLVARALGTGTDQRYGGIKRGGCGMDMGFDLVYSLSRALYPSGFDCVGDRCPSNDHSNHPRVPFTHHEVGGYARMQRWL
jgi:hypothetical protein